MREDRPCFESARLGLADFCGASWLIFLRRVWCRLVEFARSRADAPVLRAVQAALILGGLYYTISMFELISDRDKHSLPLDLASFDK
jgi:hypothetical protein